jgi:hypothetical protein
VAPDAVDSIDQYWQQYTPAVVGHVQALAANNVAHTLQHQQQQQRQQQPQQCASVSTNTSSDSRNVNGCTSHTVSASSVKARTDTLYMLIRASEILQRLQDRYELSAFTSVAAARSVLQERMLMYERSGNLKTAVVVGHLLSELARTECTGEQQSSNTQVLLLWIAAQNATAETAREELRKVDNYYSYAQALALHAPVICCCKPLL